jgi:hypothetical protein
MSGRDEVRSRRRQVRQPLILCNGYRCALPASLGLARVLYQSRRSLLRRKNNPAIKGGAQAGIREESAAARQGGRRLQGYRSVVSSRRKDSSSHRESHGDWVRFAKFAPVSSLRSSAVTPRQGRISTVPEASILPHAFAGAGSSDATKQREPPPISHPTYRRPRAGGELGKDVMDAGLKQCRPVESGASINGFVWSKWDRANFIAPW